MSCAIRGVINTYYLRTLNLGSTSAAYSELDEIIEFLKRLEFNGEKGCIECGSTETHDEDCELHNLIVRLEEE